jgi:hypothetical protein
MLKAVGCALDSLTDDGDARTVPRLGRIPPTSIPNNSKEI